MWKDKSQNIFFNHHFLLAGIWNVPQKPKLKNNSEWMSGTFCFKVLMNSYILENSEKGIDISRPGWQGAASLYMLCYYSIYTLN